MQAAHPGDVEISEPVLGVLAAMTLRQPDICTQCSEVKGRESGPRHSADRSIENKYTDSVLEYQNVCVCLCVCMCVPR